MYSLEVINAMNKESSNGVLNGVNLRDCSLSEMERAFKTMSTSKDNGQNAEYSVKGEKMVSVVF